MTKRKSLLISTIIVGLFLVLALTLTIATLGQSSVAQSGSGTEGVLAAERLNHYNTLLQKSFRNEAYLVAPREDVVYEEVALRLGAGATKAEIETAVQQYYADFYAENNKVSRPNPLAYLGRMKQLEIAEQKAAEGIEVSTELTGTPELLTVMMNFDGIETYTASDPVAYHGSCLTDTAAFPPTFTLTVDGPAFNEVAQPDDNWTPWLDPNDSYTNGFTKEYFDLLMYSETGYTQTMRPELPNPWTGGNGFDFSGVSFRNWYAENSRGVYVPQGEVIEITLPEAVSFFGAARCNGAVQDDGYWGRPRYTVAISAAQQINSENPNFDWTVWDQEDVFDYNNNGDFFEPDGYVDHFFLIEAGQAQGGIYDEFMIWPHSSDIMPGAPGVGPAGNQLGGFQVSTDGPLGGVWVLNYTVSDEVGGLGVLVHEYGHDIGLPDNYAISGAGEANTGFWDQMSSGTFGGALSGMHPAHHTIWDKSEPYLGWNTPVEIDLDTTTAVGEDNALEFVVGQQSIPPAGTVDGLRVVLPPIEKTAFVQPYDSLMWWSDQGDDRNESIAHNFTAPAGEDVTVSAQLAYAIEEDWDYLYWEVSGTGTGGDFVPLDVFDNGMEITTDTDPNGNNFVGNGITGSTSGWITATATIPASMHQGNEFTFRFRYLTDAAVQEEGVYLDNISLDSASGNIFFDDMESGDNWTHMSEGINTNNPWFIFDGTILVDQSYLVEWRNSGEGSGFNGVPTKQAFATAGFDIGLNRMYWIDEFSSSGIAHVDPFFVHTPGMVVWYANGTYDDNSVSNYIFDDPSWGAKGRVLAVDANPDPYYVDDAAGQRIVSERRTSFDAAFTLSDRPPMTLSSNAGVNVDDPAFTTSTDMTTTIPGAPAEPIFRDRIGSVPGVVGNFFIDSDHGVVLPTRNNVPYWTYWDTFGDLGNPGLNAFGVNLEVVDQAEDGTWARVKFWRDDDTVFLDKRVSQENVYAGDQITITINLKDASGSRYEDSHQHMFDAVMVESLPEGATIVPGSLQLMGSGDVYTSTSKGPDALETSIGTFALNGNAIVWTNGTLGGNRLGEPDAWLQFSLIVPPGVGCLTSESTLIVSPQYITDTFRNSGDPFLWPKHSLYTNPTQLCSPNVFMPLVAR